MIDTTLLGETAAKCMEYMDEAPALDGGEIVSCAIVVIAQSEDKTSTFTRTFCSDEVHYRQIGIFTVGLECVSSGIKPTSPDEDDDEDS